MNAINLEERDVEGIGLADRRDGAADVRHRLGDVSLQCVDTRGEDDAPFVIRICGKDLRGHPARIVKLPVIDRDKTLDQHRARGAGNEQQHSVSGFFSLPNSPRLQAKLGNALQHLGIVRLQIQRHGIGVEGARGSLRAQLNPSQQNIIARDIVARRDCASDALTCFVQVSGCQLRLRRRGIIGGRLQCVGAAREREQEGRASQRAFQAPGSGEEVQCVCLVKYLNCYDVFA